MFLEARRNNIETDTSPRYCPDCGKENSTHNVHRCENCNFNLQYEEKQDSLYVD